MLRDYINQYYAPHALRATALAADDFAQAKEIAAWKKHVRKEWENVEVISRTEGQTAYDLTLSKQFHTEIELQLGDLSPEDVGIEAIFAQTDVHGKLHIVDVKEFDVVEFNDGVAKYEVNMLPEKTGAYQVGARVFAKNALMPHRQDFECVKWL